MPFDRVHIERYTSSSTDELDVYFVKDPPPYETALHLELRPNFFSKLAVSDKTATLLSAASDWVEELNRNILQPALIPYLTTRVTLGVTSSSEIERTVSRMFQGDLKPLEVSYHESRDRSYDF